MSLKMPTAIRQPFLSRPQSVNSTAAVDSRNKMLIFGGVYILVKNEWLLMCAIPKPLVACRWEG